MACKLIANALYATQYLLLGAFVGVAMDISSTMTSAFAYKKESPFVSKYKIPLFIFTNLEILAVGLIFCESGWGLLAVLAALIENISGWMKTERLIRLVSLFTAPCWLVYNISVAAYGSAIGSVLTIISIVSSLIYYSILDKKSKEKNLTA